MSITSKVLLDDWYPVAAIRDFSNERPLAVRLLGEDLVLWRNEQVMAWQDRCVHRGTRLSLGKVEDSQLVCPYHGWHYDATGRCCSIPAHPDQKPPEKARAKTYRVAERYGLAWVSLGDPAGDVPAFPDESDGSLRKVLCGPSPMVNAGAARIIENFLDVGHFPFVHTDILGVLARPEVPEYEVETGSEGIVARNIRVYQPDPFGTGIGAYVTYTYRVLRPFAAYLSKDADDGGRFSLAAFLTPHDETHTTAWFYMAVEASNNATDDELIDYQNAIFAQDRPIVESQRPARLPLDLTAELHLRSDRTAIAYRRWLQALGLDVAVS